MDIDESEQIQAEHVVDQIIDESTNGVTANYNYMVKCVERYGKQERERTSEAHGEVSPLEGIVSLLDSEIRELEEFLESPTCDDNVYYRITNKQLPHLKGARDYLKEKAH